MSEEAPAGIQIDAVTRWFEANIEGVRPPLAFEKIAGGHSNLTCRVVDSAGERYVLRRPPLGHLLPSAHDMGREFRIISALGPTPVPVPRALGYCDDESVNERPFYVMSFVDGHVLHDADIAREALGVAERRKAGEHFVDVLADLHACDVDEIGLGTLAKREDYIARQLRRWYGQWEKSKTRDLPAVDRVHDFLLGRIPEQGRPSVVHGDYRLGNCITTSEGRIAAVLDWEICTLGDPLADLGYVLSSWPATAEEAAGPVPNAPSIAEGFPSRDEIIARYAERSGCDVSQIAYYWAFSLWKSACIVEGVYARYLGGALGEKTREELDPFRVRVERMAEEAEAAVGRMGG